MFYRNLHWIFALISFSLFSPLMTYGCPELFEGSSSYESGWLVKRNSQGRPQRLYDQIFSKREDVHEVGLKNLLLSVHNGPKTQWVSLQNLGKTPSGLQEIGPKVRKEEATSYRFDKGISGMGIRHFQATRVVTFDFPHMGGGPESVQVRLVHKLEKTNGPFLRESLKIELFRETHSEGAVLGVVVTMNKGKDIAVLTEKFRSEQGLSEIAQNPGFFMNSLLAFETQRVADKDSEIYLREPKTPFPEEEGVRPRYEIESRQFGLLEALRYSFPTLEGVLYEDPIEFTRY